MNIIGTVCMREKLKMVKERLYRLLMLNNSPHEIALGVAMGVFIGIMPLYGLHTLLVILAAVLIRRSNKVAILLGTNISIPPTVPFITWAGYTIGRHVLGEQYPPFRWDFFSHFSYRELWKLYFPLFVGSLILALLASGVFYILTTWIAGRWHRRQSKQGPRI